MFGKLVRFGGAVTLLWVALGAGAVAYALTRSHSADLKVSAGTAAVKLEKVKGAKVDVLSGSFRIADAGAKASPRSVAWAGFASGSKLVKVQTSKVSALRAGKHVTVKLSVSLKTVKLAKLNWTIRACAILGTNARKTPAKDGCRTLGRYDLAPKRTGTTTSPAGTTAGAGSTTTSVVTTPVVTSPVSTTTATPPTPPDTAPEGAVPTDPVTGYTPDQRFFEADGLGQYEGTPNTAPEDDAYGGGFFTRGYWVDVPSSYDESNQTPETLVVWLHGCGGVALDDEGELTYTYTSDRPYIMIAPNGPEASDGDGPACWDTTPGDPTTDVTQVLTDIAQVETEFNIDKRRVIIAGYSSGGDLAYETAFLHAKMFAGLLANNTDPVRDNTFGGDIDSAIADAEAAGNTFPIDQLAHNNDTTYPPSGVEPHMDALSNAGFPVNYEVLQGTHYDADAPAGCTGGVGDDPCTYGTYHDIATYLLSTIATDGWQAPVQ